MTAGALERLTAQKEPYVQVRGGDREEVGAALRSFLAESDILEMPDDDRDDLDRFSIGESIDRLRDVTELPEGFGFKIDFYEPPPAEDARGLLDHLVAWLEAAEVGDVTVDVLAEPVEEDLDADLVRDLGVGCVVGQVFGPPSPYRRLSSGPPLPDSWIDAALGWTSSLERVQVGALGLRRRWLSPAEAAATVKANRRESVVSVESDGSVLSRSTATHFEGPQANGMSITIAHGGMDLSATERARFAIQLADLWSSLDPLPVYAFVGFQNTMDAAGEQPRDAQSGTLLYDFNSASNERIPDVYWWQLLSTGHRDTWGGWPEGAEPIDDDHAVLQIGHPLVWAVPSAHRDQEREQLRHQLARLIVDDKEATRVRRLRPEPPSEQHRPG